MKRNSTIKMKEGKCLDCDYNGPLIAGRCPNDYKRFRASLKEKPVLKPPKRINAISRTQRQKLAKYSLVRAEYLAEHGECEARISAICTVRSIEIHHKAGKIGDLLTAPHNFLAVCSNCHDWIEAHPEAAKDMGFSVSRLKTES